MKLTRDQENAVFELIQPELNSDRNREMVRRKKFNVELEKSAVEKFKKTKEYDAAVLLSKYNPSLVLKGNIHIMACNMFDVRKSRMSEYFSIHDERQTIRLLAIDCKSLDQLLVALCEHYSLKSKPTMAKYNKFINKK